MNNNANTEILDKLTKLCVCKVITRAAIKESIKKGNNTLEKVMADTGAATGSCKGCRCKYKIEELISNSHNF